MKCLLLCSVFALGCTALVDFDHFSFGSDGGNNGEDLSGQDFAGADFGNQDLSMGNCGRLNQTCCPGSVCRDGACCIGTVCAAPSGASLGPSMVCLAGNEIHCGNIGEPCCENNDCSNSSGCCVGGFCLGASAACGGGACVLATPTPTSSTCGSCGGDGQNCCPGNMQTQGKPADYCVASGLVCDSTGKCSTCGGPTEPCCDANFCRDSGCCDHSGTTPVCVPVGNHCGGANACVDSSCNCTANPIGCPTGNCGRLNEACCSSAQCVAPFTRCAAGLCIACGNGGQPCCPSSDPQKGWCAAPFLCGDQETCRRCGDHGDPCCAGGVCNPGVGPCDSNGQCP